MKMICKQYFKEKETNLKDQIQLLRKEVRFLKSKKYIKETAIQILKDKDHTNAQAKFLITGINHVLNCEFCLDNHGKNIRRHLNM